MNRCENCKHWMGRGKYSPQADCYMVMAYLVPNFLNCISDLGYKLTVPFDPHTVKFYVNSLTFKKLYRVLSTTKFGEEIKRERVKEPDFVYDSVGNLYLKNVKLLFIQTRKDYTCHYHERRDIA